MSFFRAGGSNLGREGPAEGLSLEELARLREGAYRLFGALFLHPDEEWIATLPRVAEELLEESQPFMDLAFWGPWERLLGSMKGLGAMDRPRLEALYVNELTVPSGERSALPYESAYYPPEDIPWVMAEVGREYSRDGFHLAPSFPDPPDHAAVELDFMGLLCRQEAEAWRHENLPVALGRLDRERSFLLQHLLRWFPEFTRHVVSRDADGFYALAAGAAQAFIAHDLDLVGALLRRFGEVAKG
jgi:TorA maturation chaperone TorD